MGINNIMKKTGISIFILFGFCIVVYVVQDSIHRRSNKEPYIYHLRETDDGPYYVYPNFINEHKFIKYLFDFANENLGTMNILTRRNDVYFERKLVYWNEPMDKHHHFFFARQDSCDTNYEFIVVNYLKNKNIQFQVKTTLFENGIEGKKLKADFNDINVNIIQNFLQYSRREDGDARRGSQIYIYALYDKSDNLILKQTYNNYGKYFTIEMY